MAFMKITFYERPFFGMFANFESVAIVGRSKRQQVPHSLVVNLHVAATHKKLALKVKRSPVDEWVEQDVRRIPRA